MDLAYQTNQPIFLQHHLYKGTMRYAIQFVGYDILRETILYSQLLLFNFIDVILHKHMRVCSRYTNTKPTEPLYIYTSLCFLGLPRKVTKLEPNVGYTH